MPDVGDVEGRREPPPSPRPERSGNGKLHQELPVSAMEDYSTVTGFARLCGLSTLPQNLGLNPGTFSA